MASNYGLHCEGFPPTLASRSLPAGLPQDSTWPDREADGAMESTTPSKMSTRDEMGRLEKVIYDTEPSIFSSLSEQSYVIARQKI